MWIKKEGCETVNLDYVVSIEKSISSPISRIRFFLDNGQIVSFTFKIENERNEYYENLMDLIEAKEILTMKF